MKLLELYTAILQIAGLRADETGLVSFGLEKAGKSRPTLVKGKRLALPTPERLRNPTDDVTLFHPLRESAARGESDVVEKYRNSLKIRLNYIIGMVFHSLLELADSPEEQKKLTPDQAEFLIKVKDADKRSHEDFLKIVEEVISSRKSEFVSIYVKHPGVLAGRKYARVCAVTFPFLEALDKAAVKDSDKSVFGVKLRVKDIKQFRDLFLHLLPGADQPETYYTASDSDIAPHLESILASVVKLADKINAVVSLHAKPALTQAVGDVEDLTIDLSWKDAVENVHSLRGEIHAIPQQLGNEGKQASTAPAPAKPNLAGAALERSEVQVPREQPAAAQVSAPAHVALDVGRGFTQPAVHVAAPHTPVAAQSSGNAVTFSELVKRREQQALQQQLFTQQHPQPVQNSFGFQPSHTPAPVEHTNRGVKLSSLLAVNPLPPVHAFGNNNAQRNGFVPAAFDTPVNSFGGGFGSGGFGGGFTSGF